MGYAKYLGYIKYPVALFIALAFVPTFGQNSWNTELIGIAGQDDSFLNYVVHDNYLYAITEVNYFEFQLVIVDIADPSRPQRLWSMFRHDIDSDIIIVDDYLYLNSSSMDSILIYSLDDPTLPMEAARIGLGITISNFKRISDTLIASLVNNRCYIIDVQDPLNPRIKMELPLFVNPLDVYMEDNYVYIAGTASPFPFLRLEIYDISDTLAPARVYYATIGDGSMAGIVPIGDYLYYSCSHYGLKILDVSNPYNPVFVDSLFAGYRFYSIKAAGTHVFLSGDFDSLLILDATDPAHPTQANAVYTQAKSDRLRLMGNKLYFRTDFDILQMYDITDPAAPSLDGRYIVGSMLWDVAKWGNYIYAVQSFGGFRIFDVSDPEHPFGMGYNYSPNQTANIQIDNGILALADRFGGALIFSLADPANPVLHSTIDSSTMVTDVLVLDTLLFISEASEYENDFRIEDISDPSDPVFLGRTPWSSYNNRHNDIISYGSYVYTAESDSGICVYDVSDPTDPQRIACVETGIPNELSIQGNYLYSADHHDGMNIFDISDPISPVLLSTTPPAQAYSISVYGEYAYLAYKNDINMDCRTFDISDPLNPVLVGTYDAYGSGIGIYAENDTVYVGGGSGGLWILRHRNPTNVNNNDADIIPRSLSFSSYPNPFNAATTIRYYIPNKSEISLSVYNLLGQKVETLLEGNQTSGEHTITWDASRFPSGIYFARLVTRCRTENIKMVLLK